MNTVLFCIPLMVTTRPDIGKQLTLFPDSLIIKLRKDSYYKAIKTQKNLPARKIRLGNRVFVMQGGFFSDKLLFLFLCRVFGKHGCRRHIDFFLILFVRNFEEKRRKQT